MENKPRLEIKSPCQADWSKMSLAEAGRYCSNCEKTVLDFSLLNKDQIIEKISNTNTSLCIKANKTEIDLPINSCAQTEMRQGYRLAASLLLFGAVTSSFSSAMDTQPLTTLLGDIEKGVSVNSTSKQTLKSDSNKVMIKGKVLDSSSKLPLDFVSIYIKGTQIGWITDSTGNFSFEIPKDYQGKSLVLVCAYVGYHSKEINIEPQNLNKLQLILISEANFLIGEVIIKKYPEKKAWQFWK